MYCTYLTIYSGNKLPPFYIGYKLTEDVLNGYHGSVRSRDYITIWKSELKDNPQLFKTIILTRHQSRKDAKSKETHFQRFFQVHKNPMYINRCINGENFYTEGPRTEETKSKISQSHKGKILSETHKENIAKSKIGKLKPSHTESTKQKMSASKMGKKRNPFTTETILKMSKPVMYRDNLYKSVKDAALILATQENLSRKYCERKIKQDPSFRFI